MTQKESPAAAPATAATSYDFQPDLLTPAAAPAITPPDTPPDGQSSAAERPSYHRARQLGIWVALVVMVLDALTKYLALQTIFTPPRSIPVIENLLHFTPAWNRGVSFSFLSTAQADWLIFGVNIPADAWLPAVLALVALLASGLFYHLLGHEKTLLAKIGIGMIIGGALGNMLDRLQHGAVVDFLHVFWQPYHFPIFNLADCSLTCGVLLLLYSNMRHTLGYIASKKPQQEVSHAA